MWPLTCASIVPALVSRPGTIAAPAAGVNGVWIVNGVAASIAVGTASN